MIENKSLKIRLNCFRGMFEENEFRNVMSGFTSHSPWRITTCFSLTRKL